jgi:hypothetical protein
MKINNPTPNGPLLRRYSYFDVVVGLAGSNDPESSDGGNVATGRASHARQVKGDVPDKKGFPGPPGWVWAYGRQPYPVKICFVEKLLKLETGLRNFLEEAKVHRGL